MLKPCPDASAKRRKMASFFVGLGQFGGTLLRLRRSSSSWASCRAASARFRSVMLWHTPITEVICPASSRRG